MISLSEYQSNYPSLNPLLAETIEWLLYRPDLKIIEIVCALMKRRMRNVNLKKQNSEKKHQKCQEFNIFQFVKKLKKVYALNLLWLSNREVPL